MTLPIPPPVIQDNELEPPRMVTFVLCGLAPLMLTLMSITLLVFAFLPRPVF